MATHALYGVIPIGLAQAPAGAEQFSPLVPGSRSVDELQAPLASLNMLAPPGTIERRYVMAKMISALDSEANATIQAPKDKGGSRLAKELKSFGCEVEEDARQHHRICTFTKPAAPTGLEEAILEGAPRFSPELQLHTQPGVFSWDRLDIGSLLLLEHLPSFSGKGADLGCGLGILSKKVLQSKAVRRLHLADIDGRAVAAARKNVTDARAEFHWADLRTYQGIPTSLDFVVTNPPFHDAGAEDQSLGLSFIKKCAGLLREGGPCWLVANRHLPYEDLLKTVFAQVRLVEEKNGFKVYEALK